MPASIDHYSQHRRLAFQAGTRGATTWNQVRIYYFDLQDGVAVRDRKGLELVSDGAAIEHSKRLAKLIRDKRQPDRKDLNVVVLDEDGREIHREVVYPAVT